MILPAAKAETMRGARTSPVRAVHAHLHELGAERDRW